MVEARAVINISPLDTFGRTVVGFNVDEIRLAGVRDVGGQDPVGVSWSGIGVDGRGVMDPFSLPPYLGTQVDCLRSGVPEHQEKRK